MCAIISSKGQVTIPAAIRNSLNWATGDTLDFVLREPDRVELVIKHAPVTALKSLISKPKRALSLSEMDAAIACGGQK